MGVFEMIVLIVLIGAITSVVKHYLGVRDTDFDADELMSSMGLEDGGYSKKKLKPYLDRINQLEERVKVLERIATDKKHSLADEIDGLK